MAMELTAFQWLTYWVVYAFLTVFESAVSAVYWFRMFPHILAMCTITDLHSLLLHLQVRPHPVDGASPDCVSATLSAG
jgi:hypothetical protein